MDYGIIQVMKVIVSICLFAILPVVAVSVPTLSESEFCDTEVFTNVAFNAVRSDARHFGVSMDFSGTASNCVQIAFGHDADSDGDLSPCETRLVLGWRGGAYFIEDASGQNRISEPAVGESAGRHFAFRVDLDSKSVPVRLDVQNEAGACFLTLAGNPPEWLYGIDWNFMKVTRRGVDAAAESIDVECRYKFCRIVIR